MKTTTTMTVLLLGCITIIVISYIMTPKLNDPSSEVSEQQFAQQILVGALLSLKNDKINLPIDAKTGEVVHSQIMENLSKTPFSTLLPPLHFGGEDILDSWGRKMHIYQDQDIAPTLKKNAPKYKIAVWSDGENKLNEYGAGDDILFGISEQNEVIRRY